MPAMQWQESQFLENVYLAGILGFIDVIPAVRLVIIWQRSPLILTQLLHSSALHYHGVYGDGLLLKYIFISFMEIGQ